MAAPQAERFDVHALAEYVPEGGLECLEAVGLEECRGASGPLLGPPEQVSGIAAGLFGRCVAGRNEPGGDVLYGECPTAGPEHPLKLFVGSPQPADVGAQAVGVSLRHRGMAIHPPLYVVCGYVDLVSQLTSL